MIVDLEFIDFISFKTSLKSIGFTPIKRNSLCSATSLKESTLLFLIFFCKFSALEMVLLFNSKIELG